MLCGFGAPLEGADLATLDRESRTAALARALEATMDRLAVDAISRDPSRFRDIVQGREGMGGIYERWRHMRSVLGGKRFDPAHDARPPNVHAKN
jgi:hypothetical protein